MKNSDTDPLNKIEADGRMDRRKFITSAFTTAAVGLGGVALSSVLPRTHASAWASDTPKAPGKPSATPAEVTIVKFTDAGKRVGAVKVKKVVKTDAEWKKKLDDNQFNIARKAGTEAPYSGEYNDLHDKGIFRCRSCDNAVFNSDTKFESGTGWPSFWAPIAKENIETRSDSTLGVERIEVLCRECDAHLGHVFDDGPAPTHLRYCMNSAALRFVKARG